MSYTIFDGHCDTIQKLCDKGLHLDKNNLHLSLYNMQQNRHIQMFAAFVDKGEDALAPFKRANQLIDCYFNELNQNSDKISHCNSLADITDTLDRGKIAALLSIEGGEALEGRLDRLLYFYDKGVRALTLTWNYDNEISGSIGESDNKGLTKFGKDVICEMNSLGMLIDVSHISHRGFWDVMEKTNKPVAATHSNVFALKDHRRNLTDEQIEAIIDNNGFIGINLYKEFLTDRDCHISDIIKHTEYILALGGENNIGLGTDFDGMDSLPEEIRGIGDIYKIPDEMTRLGYPLDVIDKITYKNFYRIFNFL